MSANNKKITKTWKKTNQWENGDGDVVDKLLYAHAKSPDC